MRPSSKTVFKIEIFKSSLHTMIIKADAQCCFPVGQCNRFTTDLQDFSLGLCRLYICRLLANLPMSGLVTMSCRCQSTFVSPTPSQVSQPPPKIFPAPPKHPGKVCPKMPPPRPSLHNRTLPFPPKKTTKNPHRPFVQSVQ